MDYFFFLFWQLDQLQFELNLLLTTAVLLENKNKPFNVKVFLDSKKKKKIKTKSMRVKNNKLLNQ